MTALTRKSDEKESIGPSGQDFPFIDAQADRKRRKRIFKGY
jgi:hypothetical protein